MRGTNNEAYLPVAVNIGPIFKRSDRDYEFLEDYKWCCVRLLISRHHLLQEPSRTPTLLRRCLDALKVLEPRIRDSYPRNMHGRLWSLTEDKLLTSMLLDGCFILHRLLKYARIARREAAANNNSSSSSNPPATAAAAAAIDLQEEEEDGDWTLLFGRVWVWRFVMGDLLLLENQIPFFVVETLFQQLRTDPDESSDVLVVGARRIFLSLRPQMLLSSPVACHDVHHLLHLFYLSVGLPTTTTAAKPTLPPSELAQWVPCARDLEEAGIKFRARKGGATSFLDVRFHRGALEIPLLQLYDYSEPLLRNLIAFEHTCPFTPGHVTAYAIFMDCLVASPEDVRLLQLSGVLENHLSGDRDRDAVKSFLSRLCHEVHMSAHRNYLNDVIKEVNAYQRARWPRWRAALVRNYFTNPWVATSLAAAVFLLALTMLQTFFAAYSYFKPPN
ncbi:hypothetical protein QOZ80_5AG0379200 [Eleusine coracana subsp. coracana]|nr:hypothetical protein QOZ80_5AG0379200 [Eleusine coracana subsp. coracana]